MLITQPVVMWSHQGSCLRFFSWLLTLFPKALATGLLTWAELNTLLQLHIHYQYSGYSVLMMALVLVLYIFALYTYHKVIWVGAGSPADFGLLRLTRRDTGPYDTNLSEDTNNENDSNAKNNSAEADSVTPPLWLLTSHYIENNSTAYRSCTTCQAWKPDRCHHCSVCRRCFLRMDHHCPWFACCIGFRNHKFFIQLLIYITLFSAVVMFITVQMLYGFFAEGQYEGEDYLLLSLVFLFITALVFFFSVGCFSAFLVYLVLRNTTTIEFQDSYWMGSDKLYEYDRNGARKKLGHIYDLGLLQNWKAVMGPHLYQWCLPVSVTSAAYDNFNNGLNFLVDEDVYQKHVYNAQLQHQLNSQLHEYRDRIRGVPS